MDEQYILDLFNQLGGESKFGKFNDFKKLITTDQSYQKDFYNSFGSNTLGDFNDFRGLVSATQPAQQQTTKIQSLTQQPPAKKKELSASLLEGGWSGWLGSAIKDVKETYEAAKAPKKEPLLNEEESEEAWKKKVKREPENFDFGMSKYFPDIDKPGRGVLLPEKKYPLSFLGRRSQEQIEDEVPEFIKPILNEIDADFLKKGKDNVKKELTYYLEDAGFETKILSSYETGSAVDMISITAPNGEVREFQIFSNLNQEADKIKQFIKENLKETPQFNLQKVEKMYLEENKKFINEEEYNKEISKLNSYAEDFKNSTQTLLKNKTEIENIEKKLKEYPQNLINTPQYQKLVEDYNERIDAYNTNYTSLEERAKNIEAQDNALRRSVGEYTKMKSEQGTIGGYLWNKFTTGAGKLTSGFTNFYIDRYWNNMPLPWLLGQEAYEEEMKNVALDLDVDINKVLLTDEYFNKLSDPEKRGAILESKKLKRELEDFIRDDYKKMVKYGEYRGVELNTTTIKDIRDFFYKNFGTSGTTKEYTQRIDKEGNIVIRGLGGLAESAPSLLTPIPGMRMINMYMLTTDAVREEMEGIPEFKDISENEKEMVLAPIGIVGAVLEEIGLRSLLKGTSLIKNITGRVINNIPTGATASQIRNATLQEIKNMGLKGGAVLVGGTLAEAETGALQQMNEYAVKDLYNIMKGKDMFETPIFMSQDYINKIADAAGTEAVGGFTLSIPGSISAAFSKDGFQALDDDTFKVFEELSANSDTKKFFVIDLKNKINEGKLTKAQADKILENYDNSVGLVQQIPDEITDMNERKKAMDLLKEKKRLENKIQGKDPDLVKPIQAQINNIKEQLSKLTEDAIQKQAASQVSVQPEAGSGQEVEVGGPEAKPKITPEESKRKEDLVAALEATDKDVIAIGDELLDRKEAQAEIEAITQKEQAAVTEQGGMEQAESVQADEETRKQALRDIMQATGDDVFILGTEDGTFAGDGLLNMNENGDVVLTRFTDEEANLTKGKGVTENLASISGQFGGEQIATTGIEGGLQSFSSSVVGEYHIPLQDLIQLIKDGYIVFAGLGNKEFVLSPHIADKYLTKVNGKNITKDQATTEQVGTEQKTFEQKKSEIEKITDPEQRKVAEIEFIMSNLMSGVGEASANKIREYADRIISGKETREQVIQGLPKSFVDGIDQLLAAQQAPAVTPTATTTATEVTPAEQFTEQDRARKAELEEAMRKADKRRKNITVGETTMPKAEAKAELDALNQKEQAAQQPVTPAVEVAPTEVAPTETRTAEQEADLLEELLTGKKKEPVVTETVTEADSVIEEGVQVKEEVSVQPEIAPISNKKADIEKRIIITGTDGGFEIIDSSNDKNEQSGTLNDIRRRESDEKFEIDYGVGDNKNSLFSDMKFNDNNSYHFFVTDKKTNKRYYVVGISNRVIGNDPDRNGSLFASIEDNGNITEFDRTLLELSLIEAFNKQVKKRPNIFEALPQEFIDKVNAKYDAELAKSKPTTEVKAEPTSKEAIAKRLRGKKNKGLMSSIDFGISQALYNGALEFMASQVEKGTKLGNAIENTIKWIDEKMQGKSWDKDGFTKYANTTFEEVATKKKAKAILDVYPKGSVVGIADLASESGDTIISNVLSKMKDVFNKVKISGRRPTEGAAFYNYNTKEIDVNKNSPHWDEVEGDQIASALSHEFAHHLIDGHSEKEAIETDLQEIKDDLIANKPELTESQKKAYKFMTSKNNSPQEILTYAVSDPDIRPILTKYKDKLNNISNKLFGEDVISGIFEEQKTKKDEIQPQRTRDGRGRTESRAIAPLEGAPSVQGFVGPDPQLTAVAEEYAKENGIPYKRQAEYVKVDEGRAKRIAQAYEEMKHDPQNPKVKEAYENLIKQTIAQYEALVKAGYKFWFIDTNIPSNLEYAQSPFNAMRDVRSNKQMGVFPTTDGFGSSDVDVSDNPMMAETKFKWPVGGMDGELKPVLANDLFRAVHDAFGHGLEGAGFRARGEENAWQAHIRLFTGSAVGAITSETRGQNSWLNFGPHGEKNRAANTDETIFADQKTGLMPEWTWKEGVAADMETTAKPFATSLADAIIKNLTIKAGGLQSNILGIPIAIWNSGVKTMAAAVRAGAAINEAVQKAIEHIREKHGKKFNEAAAEKKLLIGQYKGAIEVAREAKVTDEGLKAYFKRQGLTDAQIEALLTFKEKAEKKPISKEKVIGKPKSKKVTVNEMTALKDQLRLEAKAAREAKGDLNAKRKMLTASIKEMEKKGSISARQAKALINRVNAVNLDNPVMVERLLDYAEKVFNDAAYAEKLSQAKKLQSTAKSLSKNKEKNPEVRELAKKFAEIDPALVENIDEYIEMASAVVEGVKGSKLTAKGVSLAAAVDINETSKYIEKVLEQQAEKQKQMMADKMQSLMGVDVSDLTYDQLLELLDDSSKPIDKYKETIIRDIINKMFDTYSGIIESMLETGKDPFDISEDAETIEFKDSTKQVVRNFMSIDLNSLSPREALKAVDALNNFIVNGSTANMETVYNTYLANENASTVKKKGVKGKKLTFFFVPSLGRMLLDEFASLPLLLESMFKSTNVALYFSRMSGLSNLMNGAARATTITQKTIARYLDAFSKLKPNGKAFNDAYNATERGMVAFMSRNLIGSEAKMKKEFNDRKSLVEKSIEELSKGTAKEQEKAKLYQEAYDKILDGSENAQQVKDKAAKENVEAVDWWINEWSKHFDELSDVSLNVYNKVLDRDLNYTTDRYSKLDLAAKDESVLDSNASAYHFNNGTMYKKEAGALKETTDKTGELPKNKDGEVTRYVDLSFDSIQASSLYDAMADIKTAGAIRQVDAFFKSKDTRSLFSAEDFKLLDERVKLAIRNIRNQQAFNNGEIEKLVKALDKFAKYSASIALAGVTQPFKQTIPLMFNTLINAGQFDPFGVTFNKDIKNFIDESGRAIANRGVESQVYIESINRLIDEAAKSKGEAALKLIEQANDLWMKVFLANPDRYIARASWMAYYEQSLKKQGINTKGIDYASHELNDEAADYAQMMVDRQQNITDTKLAGRMYSDTEGGWGKKVLTRMLLPLASFRLNQFIRAKSDTATLFSKTTTLQDKKKAARSLSGMAAEMLVFKSMVIGFGLTWHYISDAILAAITGDEEDEEESEKKWKVRFNNLVKGQATSTVTDLFSPIPILDPFVKYGANTALDVTQDLLKVADDDKFKLFVDDLKSPKTYASSAGMYGIGLDKINEIFKTSNLAITGKFIDDRGHERFIRDEQRSLLSWLLIPSVVFNAGLLPGAPEFNNITGKITKDIKYSGMTEKQMDVYKKTGLDKDEIKRSKEKAFKGYSSEKQFEENDPEGYLKAVEDGTIYDYRKQQQDIRIATEEMSPEQLYKVNPTLWKKKYGPGTDYYKQQRTPAARKKAREEQRYKAELKAKKEVIEAKRQREEARKKRRY